MLTYFAFSFGFRFPEENRYHRIARPNTQFREILRMAQNATAIEMTRKRLPKQKMATQIAPL